MEKVHLSFEEVLRRAIDKEATARAFYIDLVARVADPATKDTLLYLAAEEERHKSFLEDYLRGAAPQGSLGLTEVIDYKIIEHLEEVPLPSETLRPEAAYLLAAQREKASYEFYRALAKVHPEGAVRSLLEAMATEELRHKEKVEYLYANTAFPQTAGG